MAQSASIGTIPMSPSMVGNQSFVLTSNQTNSNAFMVAQPLAQPGMPGSTPTNCIIRLPDGRLIMQNNPNMNTNNQMFGLPQSSLTCLSAVGAGSGGMGSQPTSYYSISMSNPNTLLNSSAAVPAPINPHLGPTPGQVSSLFLIS